MSQTGLCESEVRSIDKYKIMLSESKNYNIPIEDVSVQKATERMLKSCTKKMKLPKEHHDVRTMFEKEWKRYWAYNEQKICKHYDVVVWKKKEKTLLIEKVSHFILEGAFVNFEKRTRNRPYN